MRASMHVWLPRRLLSIGFSYICSSTTPPALYSFHPPDHPSLSPSLPPSLPPSPSYLLQRVPIRLLNGRLQPFDVLSLLQLYQQLGPCLLDLCRLVFSRRGGRRQGERGGGKEEKGTGAPSGLVEEGVLSSLQGSVALGGWLLLMLHGGADAGLPGEGGDGEEEEDDDEEGEAERDASCCCCFRSLAFHGIALRCVWMRCERD